MLIGTYRGLNGSHFHPLHELFREYPSWEAAWSNAGNADSLETYMAAVRDENRVHPIESYAVFDSEKQVFEKWPWLKSDPNLYVVGLYTFVKAEQPKSGGWRWHKWGTYLGDKNPQCEYLYDEGPEITQATVAEVHEIDPEAALAYIEGVTVTGGKFEGF